MEREPCNYMKNKKKQNPPRRAERQIFDAVACLAMGQKWMSNVRSWVGFSRVQRSQVNLMEAFLILPLPYTIRNFTAREVGVTLISHIIIINQTTVPLAGCSSNDLSKYFFIARRNLRCLHDKVDFLIRFSSFLPSHYRIPAALAPTNQF